MKKLLLILITVISVSMLNAQTDKGTASKAPAENPADPMVNGMPYTQWKAKQEKLKQDKAAREAQQIAAAKKQNNEDVITLTPSQARPQTNQPVKQTWTPPAENATPALGIPSTPAIKVTEDAPAKEKVPASSVVSASTPANAPTVSLADLPMVTLSAEETQAANKTKEAEAKKQQEITKAISQKPVVPETAKVKSEQDIKNMPVAPKTTEAPVKLEKAPVKEN